MALLESVILTPDTRANQPAANTVAVGTLYCVTDEGDILERSNGTTWDPYSPAGGGGGSIGGSTGGTDEAVLVADGTGGSTLKATPVIIDSATGLITFPDGVRQTFNPNGTTPGLNVGSQAGDPSTPSNGDLWYDSTGNLLRARINGASVSLGAGGGSSPWPAFTTPVDGDFSWVNQGGASVTVNANGGIFLRAPAGSVNLRCRVQSAPSTPYTVTAFLMPAFATPNFQHVGLCFRESGSGAIQTFGWQNVALLTNNFTNPTTYSSTPLNLAFGLTSCVYLRIADDGTNRIFSYSVDGYNFVTVLSVGRTSFLTADQVGFFANDQTGTYDCGVTLLSWVEA